MARQVQATPAICLSDQKILVVDDYIENLQLLREFLSPVGFDLSFATSGAAAIKIAEKYKPDLVLLDIVMPELDGFQTYQRLCEKLGEDTFGVIFITGRNDVETIQKAFQYGAVDYISKPIIRAEVINRVTAYLQYHSMTNDVHAMTDFMNETHPKHN